MASDDARTSTISRRSFLKTTGVVAGAGALSGLTGCASSDADTAAAVDEKTVVCNCKANCHWACLHDVKVKNGVIASVTAHPFGDDNYTSCCQRGIANAQRAYSPYRVKYPMKRKEGTERGAGEWEKISWDQAIEEIAKKFCYYRDTYGGKSIVKDSMSGGFGMANGSKGGPTKLGAAIGCTASSSVDDRNSCAGTKRVMGVGLFGFTNEPKSVLESKMVVVWGTNPCVSMPHLWRFMMLAQEAGTKIVDIDVVRSITSYKADQYMQVVPGSDLYMVLAMCNYIIQNKLYPEDYQKTRTNAPFLVRADNGKMYTEIEDYASRKEADYWVYDPTQEKAVAFADAADVALEWSGEIEGVKVETAFSLLKKSMAQYSFAEAEKKTGVKADVIEAFAKEFATIGPVTIHATYGLDHYNNGCMAFAALSTLLALTGNFGRHGAGFTGIYCPGAPLAGGKITAVSKSQPQGSICSNYIPEVFETQKWLGQDYPLKAMFSAGANPLSNQGDQNRWMTKTFKGLEYWVVMDRAWTDSALHADMVLPITDFYEVLDYRSGQNVPYVVLGEKAIEPPYECKNDSEIFNAIGRAMGYTDDFPATIDVEQQVKQVFDENAASKGWTFEGLLKTHYQRINGTEDGPGAVQGIENNPTWPTKSGRLELYWEDPAVRENYGQTITQAMIDKEHLPYWMEPTEAWPTNPLHDKYPLVFLQLRSRFRTHTQSFEVPWFKEIEPEPYVRMSRADMDARGIADGDYVEVFNDRGHCVCKAVLDDGYAPGVVCIPKGWQRHQFKAGGYQELTTAVVDPWGVGGPMYDALVDVRKWNE